MNIILLRLCNPNKVIERMCNEYTNSVKSGKSIYDCKPPVQMYVHLYLKDFCLLLACSLFIWLVGLSSSPVSLSLLVIAIPVVILIAVLAYYT